MAMNVNKVIVQCNLTKNPECIDVNNHRLCKLSLASNREYKGKKETCFIDSICWDKELNKTIETELHIGSQVIVEGRLQLDSWVSKTGEKRYKHVIVIEHIVEIPRDAKKEEVEEKIPETFKSFTSEGKNNSNFF